MELNQAALVSVIACILEDKYCGDDCDTHGDRCLTNLSTCTTLMSYTVTLFLKELGWNCT